MRRTHRVSRHLFAIALAAAVLALLGAGPAAAGAAPPSGTAAPAATATGAAAVPSELGLLAGSGVAFQDGWYVVRLCGTPYQIGYQRGHLTPQLTDYWLRSYLGPAGSSYRQLSRTVARRVV